MSSCPSIDTILSVSDRRVERLSPREQEVLALMAHGMTNSAVAEALQLSVRTVESHMRSVLAKIVGCRGASNRRALAIASYWADRVSAAYAPRPDRVVVEVHLPAREELHGCIVGGEPFQGWIGLAAALERRRRPR